MVYDEEEVGDLGQQSRESKWIMISLNQIGTTNKTFPRIPNRFTIHMFHDPTLHRKTQLSLPYSNACGCLLMTELRCVTGEGIFHHFRGKRYKYRTLAGEGRLEGVWMVLKQRFGQEERGRKHRKEEVRRFGGYCRSIDSDDGQGRDERGGIQD